LKQLWAPWRIEYIKLEKPPGCILCDKPKENKDAENLILGRGHLNFVMMNKYPYNAGHLMVAPYRHVAKLEDLSGEELAEHYRLVQQSTGILRKVFKPAGFNIGMNMGKAAGAGIDEHIHTHIVPRWVGDTNFMPVLAEVHVINEALDDTYRNLKREFDAL
jgi:ATP adenylyltransferase